jgi:subtilase family serine protease
MLRRRALRPRLERLDGRWLPSALTPSQLDQAYGINSVTITGTGQTIAIVDAYHDPYLASDLATFDQTFGLPLQSTSQMYGNLIQVDLAGNQTNDGWAGEETLDVEWAHAVAPGARIIVVEAPSDSLNDLMLSVNFARNLPGVSVVAMSWGGSEFSGETAYDSIFTTPAGHNPVTFLAASGDQGAWGGVSWPASSPNVVAVGGTTLYTDSSGNRLYESAWTGSGGGVSQFEAEPSYQYGVQNTGLRTTPDVSLDADPNSGLYTYTTNPSDGQGGWQIVGGTSASTQIWGGLIAIADEVRAIFGKGTLDTAAVLSTLYQTPAASNDITSGFNGYQATTGYDLVTGLGSPRAWWVFAYLYGPNVATPTSPSVATASATSATASPNDAVQATSATPATSDATSSASTAVSSAILDPIVSISTTTSSQNPAATLPATNAPSAPSNAVPQGLTREVPAMLTTSSDESPVPTIETSGDEPPPAPVAPLTADDRGRSDSMTVQPNGFPTGPAPIAIGPAVADLRPSPASPSDVASGPDPDEGPTEVSLLGVAAVAVAVTAWRSRIRYESATPRGPVELFLPRDGLS